MARPVYRLLAHSLWDLVPIVLGVAHLAFVLWLVLAFHSLSWWVILPAAVLYAISLSWSINSISHNQIHNAYFSLPWMNRGFDLLLSVTIGFSQTLYRDIHNRHHRGNSDRPAPDGTTVDPLSIYLHGRDGQPDNVWAYTFLSFFRDDPKAIYQEMQRKRPADARWVKVEIGVTLLGYAALALYDWHAVLVLLPFWYLGQCLSSLNGYYEHLGGNPDLPIAWGVSSYSPLYNLLWMNNGYHAEHHYRPKMHWTRVKAFHREIHAQQRAAGVKVIPLAHGLGFLLKHPQR
ncbi:fatty acid desaturase family protein [Pseudomonas chlororaphis]|uniref:Fatty acid desaturase n=1 Tax=Pseudomonas chlororaphis TaxID=587753 RepID=A0A0D5XVW3_9PSED|nr:fatty acid desaturase [Pseudomonas chlororaphis]AKA22824.1 fatty acid desaturase [Pseudomonas chlororaphis]MCB2251846.1 fatty acid desaturase [Pseudomonas chlororaphis]